jgi:polyhydroxyalkanoate synthesis regulator phasin
MIDTLRKLLLAGLGALDMTEEKAKAFFADLVARGELSEKDAKEVIASWSKRAAEQRDHLQKDVEQAVHGALGKMGIARQTEIDALKAKIADLESKLAGKDSEKSA